MKKTLIVILMVLSVVSFAFAADPKSSKGETSTTIGFNFKPENVNEYRFGFTNSDIGADLNINKNDITNNVPGSDLASITMNYDKKTGIATNSTAYIYYKFKSNASIYMSLTATALKAGENVISYDISIDGAEAVSITDGTNPENVFVSKEIAMENGFAADAWSIGITTGAINASQVGEYSGTLTLKIAPNA